MKYTANGKWVRPVWISYLFGGISQLPPEQGGGYTWRANIIRRTQKYYDEGWDTRYELREWLRKPHERH